MPQSLPQTWDMDAIFPGGSESKEFGAFLASLQGDIEQFGVHIRETKELSIDSLSAVVSKLQSIGSRLKESYAFAECLAAQNQKDKKAVALSGKVRVLAAEYESHLTRFDQLIKSVPEEQWNAYMAHEAFAPIAFPLTEARRRALEKMPPEMESLLGDVAVDGYHGWSELYDTTVALLKVPYEEDGKTVQLSAGQAFNKLHHPSRDVREKVFADWEEAWAGSADFAAAALNHLGGFRLQVYKHRGWDSIHKEPLDMNRMSPETLHAMWDTIDRNKEPLLDYFRKKAELLGIEKLAWHDVDAPVGNSSSKLSYDEGAELIIEQFRGFGPKLAEFAEMAFRERWIEAEDRDDKRPGGFCTSFPIKKQTRIFMTYEGTMNNVSTLAHELGHAFHQYVMDDMPELAQNYASNVAETASTFAEMVVSDAAIRAAKTRDEKLALLDDKIQRTVAFMMNIHARFIFETNFYEERKQGSVSIERLNELMVDAQRNAYRDGLQSYHPHFWASKLHFYITDVPFYNFPYTFGFLFSSGIYARAASEGKGFEEKYIALLRDTGSMTVEELANKHLGVDLTKPDFWQASIDMLKKDIEAFIAL
ncbi:M3 family oligoendopeptidase [Paenibacillus thermotolerans]|uniref:M3 family oligoendopeptidase n=1 Tax=Paenibacillus thermotolerans TaxID=3027807 RepID=UPI002368108F|nr:MULTISPECIES: M3 family oligoendopeptidase [unclassified Paenibacillus]